MVTLERLEWNTIENLVLKWNQAFGDLQLDDELEKNSLISQHN